MYNGPEDEEEVEMEEDNSCAIPYSFLDSDCQELAVVMMNMMNMMNSDN